MKHWMQWLTTIAIVFVPALLFAQDAAPAAAEPINWGPIAGAGIGVLTMVFVELVKVFKNDIPGSVKQILALVAAPALTWLATFVSAQIGYPVEFSSLLDAITSAFGSGLTAMGAFEVLSKLGVVKR
jgi:hypothetical protein